MGTTIAGNQHIGDNYQQFQYIWAPGLGGDNAVVERYDEDRIFVYQFNPLYDQRDDGVLAIEFYYYYRKPTSEKFYKYCYTPEDYYIYPFFYRQQKRYVRIHAHTVCSRIERLTVAVSRGISR